MLPPHVMGKPTSYRMPQSRLPVSTSPLLVSSRWSSATICHSKDSANRRVMAEISNTKPAIQNWIDSTKNATHWAASHQEGNIRNTFSPRRIHRIGRVSANHAAIDKKLPDTTSWRLARLQLIMTRRQMCKAKSRAIRRAGCCHGICTVTALISSPSTGFQLLCLRCKKIDRS